MIDWYARRRQLRRADPHGQQSDNEIDDQIEREKLHEAIANLPDHPEPLGDIKSILSDIVGRLDMRSVKA